MKTNVKILKSLLLLFMVATLMGMVSCSAEDGRDGVDGAQGEQGDSGDDGISNIEVSEWLPIDFDFINETSELGRIYIEIPDMVQFVEDGGFVLMYLREISANTQGGIITPLPYETDQLTLTYLYGDFMNTFGHIGITFQAIILNGDVTLLEDESLSYQYILIPTGGGRSSLDFSKMSYEEVMDYFGIVY